MTQQKSKLHKTLWDISNTLRGNMGADEFRDYILGFIFYKYLSEKTLAFARELLASEGKDYKSLPSSQDDRYIAAIKTNAPLFRIGFLEKFKLFYPSRIHTNPKQLPPKTASRESHDRVMIDEVKRGFGLCPLV